MKRKKAEKLKQKGNVNVHVVHVPFTSQSNSTLHCSNSTSSIGMATTSLLFFRWTELLWFGALGGLLDAPVEFDLLQKLF